MVDQLKELNMLYRIYDRQESMVVDSKDYLLNDNGTLFNLATGEVDMCRYRVDLFTGLIDSEGVPVFENDIVSLEVKDNNEDYEHFDGMNVSYDSENHQFMVKTRAAKVEKIADYIPLQTIDSGAEKGKVLVLGWGSTYGTIKSAALQLQSQGKEVSHAHIKYMRPFPKNLGDILKNFETILIPEINNGQLIKIIRDQYFVDAKGYNKIMGVPITKQELVTAIESYL
jgi:2-oxoglutarate ferredoxin oxidoreductase subunit alpha